MQSLEPGRSILVVERDSVLHLFDVCRRMEIIRVKKDPVQLSSDLHSDSRLPGTGYTHENYRLRMIHNSGVRSQESGVRSQE